MNEHVVLDHNGARLVIAGVTDFSAHHFDPANRSDPAAALADAPADAGAKILLAHQPRSAPEAAAAGFDLQLSGHTHGGQFWPWNFFCAFPAAVHRGIGSPRFAVDLHQPRHGLLGTAETFRRALGDHKHQIGERKWEADYRHARSIRRIMSFCRNGVTRHRLVLNQREQTLHQQRSLRPSYPVARS